MRSGSIWWDAIFFGSKLNGKIFQKQLKLKWVKKKVKVVDVKSDLILYLVKVRV